MRGLVGVLAATALIGGGAGAAEKVTGVPMKIVGRFDAEMKDGQMEPMLDLSGVACALQADGTHRCLFVSDENNFAQFATIKDNIITPDPAAKPSLKAAGPVIGTEPKMPERPESKPKPAKGQHDEYCNNKPKDETDGEGVALAGKTYYVIGSHGCSRKDGNWRPMQMRVHRMVDGAPVESTWNLNLALRDKFPNKYGRNLDFDGLTIEGIAADKDQVWFGLRAPASDGTRLLSVNEKALFDRNATLGDLAPKVYRLTLDPKLGIRDLTWLEPHKLLALAGPPQELPDGQQFEYKVYLIDFSMGDCRAETLAVLEPVKGIKEGNKQVWAKAEGLAVLGGKLGDHLKLMVTYDKAEQGMPHLYEVKEATFPRGGYCPPA